MIVIDDQPTCPEPGIYPDVDFAEYIAWQAVNNSRLNRMAVSPRHYITPAVFSDSASLRIGSLVHSGRLEPLTLAERYAVQPAYHMDERNVTGSGSQSQSKSTKYYKDRAKEFADANAEKEIVTRADYAAMKAIVTAISLDGKATGVLNEPGPVELSIVWDDPETGIRCKGRIDKVGDGSIVDLKTTRDLSGFHKAIANYGYHRQAAHYQAGYAVLTGGELLTPWIVAVENSAPYCVQAAPMATETIEQGERERRELLNLVAECHDKGEWPGPPAPESWELPAWAIHNEPVVLTVGGVAIEV